MSAVLQVRIRDSEAVSKPINETAVAAPGSAPEDPLQLLRDAIARLNAPSGALPDQTEMADLLAEVRDALERASVIARVTAQSEEFAGQAQFDTALQVLDTGLLAYPGDLSLSARRADIEHRQRASQSAATVQTALEEAQWLLNQDRLDLAASFLREKAADLPDQPALKSRLDEIEARLPQWVQDRQVQSALGRVAALEDLQQWQVALTIVEEALHSHSASAELKEEARRIRDRLADQERQTRLARRLELIRQKISAQSWKQAGTLLESTQKEFSGAPELEPLQREVDAGLKRSECEAVVAEARQCLADGELEQAEQVLRRGLESLGREPALEALQRETESERKYREELRTAQILFGRRQLAEAERVLSGLVATNRSEACALLDAVRHARAESEEENFCERGREKALKMMQEQQFAQAIDLLRNLDSLFPGNPILERDLAAAQSALKQERPGVAAVREEERRPGRVEMSASPSFTMLHPGADAHVADHGTDVVIPASGVRRAVIAGSASLILIGAGGAAWMLSHNDAPPSRPPAAQTTVARPPVSMQISADVRRPSPAQSAAPKPAALPIPLPKTASVSPTRAEENTQPKTEPVRTPKQFVPAPPKRTAVQSPIVPLPPETEPMVSANLVSSLPVGLVGPINVPAPLATAPPQSVLPSPAPKPASVANRFQDAQLVNQTLPTYPAMALQFHVSGLVRVEAMIDEHGNVTSAKAVSGNQFLTAAAVEAVKTWKYKAATLNGQPAASVTTIQVEFKPKDDARK